MRCVSLVRIARECLRIANPTCIDDGLWQNIKPLLNRDDLSPIPLHGVLNQQTVEDYNKAFLDISLLDETDETDELDTAFVWDKVFIKKLSLNCIHNY